MNRARIFGTSFLLAGAILGATAIPQSYSADLPRSIPHRIQITGPSAQVGNASWYGARHRGHPTASGEPYDPQSLTAAHPTLPLDSTVRVTNLLNGRSVDVRVNDRGPYVGRRVIDLSAKAAQEIGLTHRGIAKVKVELLPEARFGDRL